MLLADTAALWTHTYTWTLVPWRVIIETRLGKYRLPMVCLHLKRAFLKYCHHPRSSVSLWPFTLSLMQSGPCFVVKGSSLDGMWTWPHPRFWNVFTAEPSGYGGPHDLFYFCFGNSRSSLCPFVKSLVEQSLVHLNSSFLKLLCLLFDCAKGMIQPLFKTHLHHRANLHLLCNFSFENVAHSHLARGNSRRDQWASTFPGGRSLPQGYALA
jgi:hypothetical protein